MHRCRTHNTYNCSNPSCQGQSDNAGDLGINNEGELTLGLGGGLAIDAEGDLNIEIAPGFDIEL